MDFIDEAVAGYMRGLCDRFDHPVVTEMEELAEKETFPIVGRVVGAALEMLARSIQAKRVLELGSGYGFSAYWFARAVGEGGQVILTDGDEKNAVLSEKFLTAAGLWERCTFRVGDALDSLDTEQGEFDLIYCDIDKGDYPRAFQKAARRIRKGGLYVCDNVLWSGRVANSKDDDEWTKAIRAQNEAIYASPDFLPTIIPIRDGVIAALKIS